MFADPRRRAPTTGDSVVFKGGQIRTPRSTCAWLDEHRTFVNLLVFLVGQSAIVRL
jgi:hypothetical protein